jgi:hypothetical protein
MRFLVASPLPSGGTKLIYQHQVGRNANEPFEMNFRRVAIGVHLGNPSFGVVVGERLYSHEDRQERVYVVIDEKEEVIASKLFSTLIKWKDTYLAQLLYVGGMMIDQVEVLRRTEGLTHYGGLTPSMCEKRWPTFVHDHHVAVPRTLTAPAEEELHRDIELILSAEAQDPHTGLPLYGTDSEIVHRLLFPYDFPTLQTQSGLRNARRGVCEALWMALMGLERSNVRGSTHQTREEQEYEHRGNAITGY